MRMMGEDPIRVEVFGPYYFARNLDGDPLPTDPTMVGSRPVAWTVFGFNTLAPGFGHTSVLLAGEHYTPSDVVVREAQMQLYGAQDTTAPESDSAGGVTIVKEPPDA